MKRTRILSLLLVFLLAGLARAGEEEVRMSLEDCLRRALASSLEIREGRFGPPISSTRVEEALSEFDSLLSFSALGGATKEPSTSFFSGADEVRQQSFAGTADWSRKSRLGTLYSLGFRTDDLQSNSQFFRLRPQWSNTLSFQVTQPILRGAGREANETTTRIAQAELRAAGEQFREVVESTLASVERAYWRLVFLRGDAALRRQSLATARELLRIAGRRLDAGAGTRIEVVQAEAGVAEREKEVIATEAAVRDGEDLLRSFVFPFTEDPARDLRIVPTQAAEGAPGPGRIDVEERIGRAFDLRPDVLAYRERLEAAGIRITRTENELLPRLEFFGSLDLLGVDDGFFQALQPIPGADWPGWQVGLSLEFPLGNRAARARHRRAVLERAQLAAGFESLKNRVVVDVRTAVRGIETALRQIEATRKATAAARAQYDAEEDRVRAEKSTNYQLLQVEDDLQRARTQELLAVTAYRGALVVLERATGTYAQWRGLAIPETDVEGGAEEPAAEE